MTVAVMALAGAGVGLGLWALTVWLVPPRASLAELVAGFLATPPATPPPTASASATADGSGWVLRLGRPFVGVQRAAGLPSKALAADLAITGRSVQGHLTEKAAAALVGLLLPACLELVLALGGRQAPWAVPAIGSAALGLAGFLLPDAVVRAEAARRRTSIRHALSAYLNLIQILLAGGAGVEGALVDAADVGRGWAFTLLRRELAAARSTRTTLWAGLGRLGEELQVPELSGLANAVSLAGTEGAKVRKSLAAQAAALRVRAGAEAEANANAATERMAIPGVLIAVGFIIFVFYPAMTEITKSL